MDYLATFIYTVYILGLIALIVLFVLLWIYLRKSDIKKPLKSFKEFLTFLKNKDPKCTEEFLKRIPAIFFISVPAGLLIVIFFKLEMSPDAWFYLFSTIAQTFSALVALLAIFIIPRLEKNELDKGKKEKAKYLMRISLKFSFPLIVLSFILIPFGSSIKDDRMLNIWVNYKLKWFLVFLVVGFCIGTLSKIYFALKDFLSEEPIPSPELFVSASPDAVENAMKASREIDNAKLKKLHNRLLPNILLKNPFRNIDDAKLKKLFHDLGIK